MSETTKHITTSRIHELHHFYSHFIGSGDLCFDIGANYGEKTAAFLSLGASVVAVEPQTDLIDFLKTEFSQEIKEGNLVVIEKGLDKVEGQKLLHITNDYGRTMSTFSDEFVDVAIKDSDRWKIDGTQMAELTTLDNLIKTYGIPKLCKVDVEGLDYEVLQGLSMPLDHISFEYNTKGSLIHLAESCIHYLTQLGQYEFNFEAWNQHRLILQNWVSADVMRYILMNDLVREEMFGDIYARHVKRMKRPLT